MSDDGSPKRPLEEGGEQEPEPKRAKREEDNEMSREESERRLKEALAGEDTATVAKLLEAGARGKRGRER